MSDFRFALVRPLGQFSTGIRAGMERRHQVDRRQDRRRLVSRAIEEYAPRPGMVNAIVVPWESTREALSMAVTAAKSDGWAIEHTNLGTIRLTDAVKNAPIVSITRRASRPSANSSSSPPLRSIRPQVQRPVSRRRMTVPSGDPRRPRRCRPPSQPPRSRFASRKPASRTSAMRSPASRRPTSRASARSPGDVLKISRPHQCRRTR